VHGKIYNESAGDKVFKFDSIHISIDISPVGRCIYFFGFISILSASQIYFTGVGVDEGLPVKTIFTNTTPCGGTFVV
jgi:hypothetical protein